MLSHIGHRSVCGGPDPGGAGARRRVCDVCPARGGAGAVAHAQDLTRTQGSQGPNTADCNTETRLPPVRSARLTRGRRRVARASRARAVRFLYHVSIFDTVHRNSIQFWRSLYWGDFLACESAPNGPNRIPHRPRDPFGGFEAGPPTASRPEFR